MKQLPQYNFYKTKYGEELLVDVVDLMYVKKLPAEDIAAHTLTYYDITIITEGSGFFKLNDKDYIVHPGDVVFSIPGEARGWDSVNIKAGHAFVFEEEFLISFFNDPAFLRNLSYFNPDRDPAVISLSGEMMKNIIRLVQSIKDEIKKYEVRDKHILRALLYETLVFLDREYRKVVPAGDTNQQPHNRYMRGFVQLIEEHLHEQHSTEFYADKLCISTNYLNELVNKTFGVSAKRYIQNKLLTEAKKLLKYTDMSVTEIAEELHFENASYFARFFRKNAQMTPLEYRSTHL